MSAPEYLWRFPTKEARERLAARLGLRSEPTRQDWEWEVADAARLPELVAVYESGALTEDERFVLMETILQSFDDFAYREPLASNPLWQKVLRILDENIALHIHTVCYWSRLREADEQATDLRAMVYETDWLWHVTPFLRQILEKHKTRFSKREYTIDRLIERWLQTPAPELEEIVRSSRALPVYADLGGTLLLRTDGEILSLPHDASSATVETASSWKLAALVAAVEKHPELAFLLPARPSEASDCSDCSGRGRITIGTSQARCAQCCGLGWVTR